MKNYVISGILMEKLVRLLESLPIRQALPLYNELLKLVQEQNGADAQKGEQNVVS